MAVSSGSPSCWRVPEVPSLRRYTSTLKRSRRDASSVHPRNLGVTVASYRADCFQGLLVLLADKNFNNMAA